MKPKLLVVTSTFPRWPNDTDPPFVFELCKRLTTDYDITVHAPSYPGAKARELMNGIHVHRFRYFYSHFERLAGGQGVVPKLRRKRIYFFLLPFFLLSQICSLLLLVAKIRPSIIHAHWLIPQGLFSILLKFIFDIPVVITAHGADVFSMRRPLFIIFKKLIIKNTDKIVTVSRSLSEILKFDTKYDKNIEIISMGVDSTVFTPANKDMNFKQRYGIRGQLLLFVGRLTEKKGINILIEAFSMTINKFPDCKLLIVGHGELEHTFKMQVKSLGLTNSVVFTGGIPNSNLPPYYTASDIFIGPSIVTEGGDTEGLGLTFVEAAMCGCLIIGTKVGGIEDVIVHRRNGILIPPFDAHYLSEMINSLLQNLESLSSVKHQARNDAVKRFDWKVIAAKHISVYNQIIS